MTAHFHFMVSFAAFCNFQPLTIGHPLSGTQRMTLPSARCSLETIRTLTTIGSRCIHSPWGAAESTIGPNRRHFHPVQLMRQWLRPHRLSTTVCGRIGKKTITASLTTPFSSLRIRCMAHLVPEHALHGYEASPTQTTVDVVKSLSHQHPRSARTFLRDVPSGLVQKRYCNR
jgi:hypothetical protein